jgi:hypothetical protein
MSFLRIALAALAATGLAAAGPATVKNCASGSSLFTINKLSLDPPTAVAGAQSTLYLDYTVPEGTTITDGTTTYAITLNFIPFAPSTNPLCADIPCPLRPGSYSNATTSTWPAGVSGSFTSKMTWQDAASNLLLCVQISGAMMDNQTSLVPRPSPPVENDAENATCPAFDLEQPLAIAPPSAAVAPKRLLRGAA